MASILSWSVADFKSLGQADLALPHLTVLAGANSSGKSSVLQSILMVAQSVTRGGAIIMNGPLVRLGEPRDIVREGQSAVELRFLVQIDAGSPSEGPRPKQIEVSLSLAPSLDGVSLRPSAIEICDSNGSLSFAATSERTRSADVESLSKGAAHSGATFLRVTTVSGRRAPNRMYVGFVGMTPTSLALHFDPRVIERVVAAALSDFVGSERLTYEVAQELSSLVPRRPYLREIGKAELEEKRSAQGVSAWWTPKDLTSLSEDERDALIARAASRRAANEWAVVGVRGSFFGLSRSVGHRYRAEGFIEELLAGEYALSMLMLGSFAEAIEEFGGHVKYLGPLREEPRVVQGAWDERVDALPVGIRGELTAEVLTREKDRVTAFHDWNDHPHRATLPEAASMWCDYLGIGDHIRVLDLGKLGRGVNLRVDGTERDLTMIGVGASQLLPILVACLSVERNSVVLVEQPELHLHPSVQSKLADFFLFARRDVQFVVETHSEYLITRLRRRIAEERTEPHRVQVLYAERRGAATQVRPLALTAGGDFDEWPDGFFDAQEADVRHIVRAVAARMAKERA
ncbi:DUF3696 domain-containing protein [Microbacterium sp. QXD-8]|uniref:DUF3696 domain-containing protein n=1 Tax=Microbacterium psychrotolerans TaxID=3068321 RepID=A0ABU0YW73_9MICO|nr:DUF3696 domain-containing protein [Microbacterium sp. QXD-8]MDQ7876574.1 DUF3696 domain-containing protein [Microbacterium sp. QXD-8]